MGKLLGVDEVETFATVSDSAESQRAGRLLQYELGLLPCKHDVSTRSGYITNSTVYCLCPLDADFTRPRTRETPHSI